MDSWISAPAGLAQGASDTRSCHGMVFGVGARGTRERDLNLSLVALLCLSLILQYKDN